MANFSTRLYELRIEQGLTQDELAKQLGTSRSRISMYEQGKREADFEMQENITDFFNVDTDYLLGKQDCKRKVDITKAAAMGADLAAIAKSTILLDYATKISKLPKDKQDFLFNQIDYLYNQEYPDSSQ